MLRGIWRLSGLASSQTSPSLADAEDNSNSIHPQNGEHPDQMEGLEIGSEELAPEDAVAASAKKTKSKHKAKKHKKSSKRDTGETGSQELSEMNPMENNLAADERAESANGDLPRSSKKSKKKSSRRTKSANLAVDAEMMDHIRNGGDDDDAESSKTKAAVYNNGTREDLAQLPRKMKKAKKSKSRRLADDDHVRSRDDSNSLDEALHQPLTPAHKSHLPISYHHEDNPNGSSPLEYGTLPGRMDASEGVQEDDQQQLSEKALGKRKAVDEPAKQGRKKRAKKSGSRETHEQDLGAVSPGPSSTANFNDTSSSKRSSKKRSKSNVNGLAEPQPQDNTDNSESGPKTPEQQSELPFEAAVLKSSEVRKRRKRRLPVDDDESGPPGQQENPSQLEPGASPAKTPRTPKSAKGASGTGEAPAPYRSLTAEDTRRLSQTVENYRDFNDLTQYQVNEIIQQAYSLPAGKALWKSIYEELPYISKRHILSFCRRNFHNYEGRGIWTKEQDEELMEAYQRNPNKWKQIGQELNRFAEDVRDRWRNYLICAGNMKKETWDKIEETQLRTAVEECISIIREQRRLAGESAIDEEKLIDWQKVSERMNHTRSRLQCSYKWKRMKSVSQSDDEKAVPTTPVGRSWRLGDAMFEAKTLSASDKLRLLRAVQDTGASREGKIPWGGISFDLNEIGKRMTWKVIIRKLKKKLPGYEDMKFKEILERLIDIFEASAPNEPTGFDLDLNGDDSELDLLRSDDDKLAASSEKKSKSKRKRKSKNSDEKWEDLSKADKVKRKVKDRMRCLDEGTPEPGEKRRGRKGKRKAGQKEKQKFLSDEKVVEDSSDDDAVSVDQMEQEEVDTENNADIAVKVEDPVLETESVDLDDDSSADPNDLDNYNSSALDEDEAISRHASDTGSVNLDEDHAITANGFEEDVDSDADRDEAASTQSSKGGDSDNDSVRDESALEEPVVDDDDSDNDSGRDENASESPVDEDSDSDNTSDRAESVAEDPVVEDDKTIYHRLAEKHLETYFENAESESGSDSSDDDSVSSIPAKVTRNVSIEL